MPKFLAGCHYNEEEISRHLKKNIGYWPVQTNGNKFATGQILKKKPGRSCEGAEFSWLSSKVTRTLLPIDAFNLGSLVDMSRHFTSKLLVTYWLGLGFLLMLEKVLMVVIIYHNVHV